jgi:adenylosuccinate synthase
MASQIVILSGPVASGKSTLAKALVSRYQCAYVRTQDLILSARPKTERERAALQAAGDALDRKTKGKWVAAELVQITQEHSADVVVVVDAARTPEQIEAIRLSYGPRVIHVHLTAPDGVLAERYVSRKQEMKEFASYDALRNNSTEREIERLAAIADVEIDTKQCSQEDVLVRAASHLGFYGRSYHRLVDVVVGGAYGSEGKGHIVAHLSREYDVLVRVGGPNAGHTVYEDPPYTHHHLPSGTRCSEAELVIGPGAVLYIPTLLKEIAACEVPPERLAIDPQAMIITEADREFEAGTLRGSIGSTAQGVGKATARRILRGNPETVELARDRKEIAPYVRDTHAYLDDAFFRGKKILLEGTQGTALSLQHGIYPYVTSRDTTVGGCLSEAGIAPSRVRRIVMVCRTYPIRVESPEGGTSGPIGAEISWDVVSSRSGIPVDELRVTELTSTTKRKRRVAEFDWTLLRKAASLNGPTDIALTFVDYVSIENRKARRFEQLTPETIHFIQEIERVAAAPISLISTRFHSRSIIDRRAW